MLAGQARSRNWVEDYDNLKLRYIVVDILFTTSAADSRLRPLYRRTSPSRPAPRPQQRFALGVNPTRHPLPAPSHHNTPASSLRAASSIYDMEQLDHVVLMWRVRSQAGRAREEGVVDYDTSSCGT